MFSLETYDRVRRRMDSASIFPTIDEKAPAFRACVGVQGHLCLAGESGLS